MEAAERRRSAGASQASRRNVIRNDERIIARSRARRMDKWAYAAVALGWLLAIAAVAVPGGWALWRFEACVFAALLMGLGAGWCARGDLE